MYEQKEETTNSKEMEVSMPVQEIESPQASLAEEADTGIKENEAAAESGTEVSGDCSGIDPFVEAARADLAILREEVNLLREALGHERERAARADCEQAEFRELYPEADVSALPDDVWEQVRRGVPLAAAYALSERRKLRLQEKADLQSRENRRRSFGKIEKEKNSYFSPDEVRAMTPAEVRLNYQAILSSMQKWQ